MICSEMVKRKWFSGHTHLENSWIQYHFSRKDGVFSYPPPVLPSQSSSNGISTNLPKSPTPSSSVTKISPAVLFIIVILAVIFFISGLLHLLVRFLSKKSSSPQSNRNLEDSTSDAIQRQLQQLFNLHDSGLDQAFIDALPIFSYKEILGPKKEHFDCPVCLCEFIETDQLRLLPMCGHAFHLGCIDTWLLSNSTCPLCRGTLLNPGFENPIFNYDDFREEDGFSRYGDKRIEIEEVGMEKGVFPVRLGKFRKLDSCEGGEINGESSSSSRLDTRRCYSMGSYQYVVGDAKLRVALSRDKGLGDENKGSVRNLGDEGKKISIGTKKDSYSVSKIWLWSKKDKFVNSSAGNLSPPPYLDLSWMNKK